MITEFGLGDLVVENAHLLKAAISKTAVLNLDIAENLPLIKADAGQIQQVVMNLITNASEAIGDKPGIVNIKTGVMECDDAMLSKSRTIEKPVAGMFVYLEVSDNGCGMDEETRQRLFEPFFTTKFTGRGLGMAGVHGIVSGHGGAIFVESEQGKGSTIRVMFPATSKTAPANASSPAPPSEPVAEQASKPLPGYILVVDDEESIRSLSKRILGIFGYRSLTASDGEEAEAVFREHAEEISCVLLDLTMPKKDGIATMKSLRQIKPDVRIILSSGFNEQDTAQRFADSEKPSGFIQKPYTLQNLRKEIERITNKDSA
jgi:CheY-like chemotaxis protein/two-component sensor histidine kinase